MKTLLTALALFLTLTAHAQAPWPRNAKTGKVEFTGVLPWPASAKTEAQRRALVRRWYLAKLTDEAPAVVEEAARTVVAKELLTYPGLPLAVVLNSGVGDSTRYLVYHANISPGKNAVRIVLSGFEISQGDQEGAPLEPRLNTLNPNEKAALAQLRGRLIGAIKGWN